MLSRATGDAPEVFSPKDYPYDPRQLELPLVWRVERRALWYPRKRLRCHRVLTEKVFPRQAQVLTVAEWAATLAPASA